MSWLSRLQLGEGCGEAPGGWIKAERALLGELETGDAQSPRGWCQSASKSGYLCLLDPPFGKPTLKASPGVLASKANLRSSVTHCWNGSHILRAVWGNFAHYKPEVHVAPGAALTGDWVQLLLTSRSMLTRKHP